MGGVGGLLTWVTWLVYQCGCRASMADVGGLCLCMLYFDLV